MRILSWKQPYAGLMLYGKIETRVWDTKYRGSVIIYASAGKYSKPAIERISGKMINEFYNGIAPGDVFKALGLTNTFGQLIAIGELINTWKMRPEDEEKCYVKYNPNLFCHEYSNVMRIREIPWKGKRGWTTASQETIDKIIYL